MLLIEFIVDLDFLEDYTMVRFSSWIDRSPKGGFAEGSVCMDFSQLREEFVSGMVQ